MSHAAKRKGCPVKTPSWIESASDPRNHPLKHFYFFRGKIESRLLPDRTMRQSVYYTRFEWWELGKELSHISRLLFHGSACETSSPILRDQTPLCGVPEARSAFFIPDRLHEKGETVLVRGDLLLPRICHRTENYFSFHFNLPK